MPHRATNYKLPQGRTHIEAQTYTSQTRLISRYQVHASIIELSIKVFY